MPHPCRPTTTTPRSNGVTIMRLMLRCPIQAKPCRHHHHQCNGVDARRTYKSSSCCCSSWLIVLGVQLLLTFFMSRSPILYQVPLVITWEQFPTPTTTTPTTTKTTTNTITFPSVPITTSQSQSVPLSKLRQRQQQQHSFPPHSPLFGICSRVFSSSSSSPIPSGITASSLWRRHVSDILQASIHFHDYKKRYHAKWTEQLLKLLPPRLLQASVRSHPHAATWSAILQKLSDYYQNKNKNNATLPIINVVVYGGSVTFGSSCRALPPELEPFLPRNMTAPQEIEYTKCSWPIRLQWLLDMALGKNVVQVHNLAVAATSTTFAIPLVEYRLYGYRKGRVSDPDSTLVRNGPDVIINSYATNDNKNSTHASSQSAIEQFNNACLGSRPCRPIQQRPLILYFNDYVGDLSDYIEREQVHHEVVQQHVWYDAEKVGYISSALAIQSFVYANTTETLLSPKWNRTKKYEVHFAMSGHVARAWIFAYALLEWTVNSCQDALMTATTTPTMDPPGAEVLEPVQQQYSDNDTSTSSLTVTQNASLPMMPITSAAPLSHHTMNESFSPVSHLATNESSFFENYNNDSNVNNNSTNSNASSSLLSSYELDLWTPSLLQPIRFDQISASWHELVKNRTRAEQDMGCLNDVPPCSFVFVAAPAGTVQSSAELNDFLYSFTSFTNEGWIAVMDENQGVRTKLGVQAHKKNARLVLRIDRLVSPIQVVTIQYLKSYGSKWANSTARFTLTVWNDRSSRTIVTQSSSSLSPPNQHEQRRRLQQTVKAKYQQPSWKKQPKQKQPWKKQTKQKQPKRPKQLPPLPPYLKSFTSWELEGFHDERSSVSYDFQTDLGPEKRAEVGDVVELDMELIGGATFKIVSIMMCYR